MFEGGRHRSDFFEFVGRYLVAKRTRRRQRAPAMTPTTLPPVIDRALAQHSGDAPYPVLLEFAQCMALYVVRRLLRLAGCFHRMLACDTGQRGIPAVERLPLVVVLFCFVLF